MALGKIDEDVGTWSDDMRVTLQYRRALFGNMIGFIDLNSACVPNGRWLVVRVLDRVRRFSFDGSASASKFHSTLACALNDRTLSGLRQCIPLSFIFN